ncbi:hypothetical protein Tco_0504994 [Tanacetum coccineum]
MADMIKALQERPQGALPSNTQPNPRADIKAITTRSGIVLDGPSVPPPPPLSSSKESPPTPASSEIPPPPISSELPKRNPHQPPIPYPSRLNKDKLQDKYDIQVHQFYRCLRNFISISVLPKL